MKVCSILDQFRDRELLGVTEVSRKTGLVPSDVHRILTSLEACGYVEQDRQSRRYGLGQPFLRMGLFQRSRFRKSAHRALTCLSREIDAATHLALYDARQSEIILIDEVDRSAGVMVDTHVGRIERPHCTALGKVILANLSRDAIVSILVRNGMRRYTPQTIADMDILSEELQQTGRRGYAIDREESVEGICCVATAIRHPDGQVLGAIGTSMPTPEFLSRALPRLAARLNAAAVQVSPCVAAETGQIDG